MSDASQVYSGHRKLERIYNGLAKTLKTLGNVIDLHTADFHRIEKFAGLIQLENHLRWRISRSYGNPEAQAFMYKILLDITDNKPLIIGYLTKARLFDLLNNTWEGERLINKFNVRYNLQCAFPHCFRYDAEDTNDVKMGKLVTLMNFNPPVVKNPPRVIYRVLSDIIHSDAFRYSSLFSFLSFVTGSIYGYILFKGLKGLQCN